ncbi:MAG: DUF1799 domain-containing protein [Alphaproteobacteria bacterium]|nr:DUF1799 domain-containing protein [Alphaproteobacteria bacterium]
MEALIGPEAAAQELAAFDAETDRLKADQDIGIWPEHWKAWQLFVRCGEAWSYIPGMEPIPQGLDWDKVATIGRLEGIRLNRHRYRLMRHMAGVACHEFDAIRKDRQAKSKARQGQAEEDKDR